MIYRKNVTLFFFLLIFFSGCKEGADSKKTDSSDLQNQTTELKKDLPKRIKKIKNIKVYAADAKPPDTVKFIREQIFNSNKDVLIKGYTGEVAVDNRNRVYIEGSVPGAVAIYVFEPNGSYITTIGRHGKGPGEFLVVGEIKIRGNELYIYDNHQTKLSVFSLNDYSLLREMIIKKGEMKNDTKLASLTPGGNFFVNDDGFLMDFKSNIAINDDKNTLYYQLSEDGEVLSDEIINLKRHYIYNTEMQPGSNGNPTLPFRMPFTRNSLVAFSNQGLIFTAWTEDFLIKVYNKDGTYEHAIYYPYKNRPLSVSATDLSERRLQLIDENEEQVPDTWPALHNMSIDDKNRLWIFTITNSDSTYKGWVLNKKGKLLAKFDWPGKRAERSPAYSPLFKIKNGHLYTRERDIKQGIDRIVKYKINFKKR